MIRYLKLRTESIISLKDLYFVDKEEETLFLTYISKSGKEYVKEIDYSDLKEDINAEKTNIDSDYDLLLEELEGKTLNLLAKYKELNNLLIRENKNLSEENKDLQKENLRIKSKLRFKLLNLF